MIGPPRLCVKSGASSTTVPGLARRRQMPASDLHRVAPRNLRVRVAVHAGGQYVSRQPAAFQAR